MQDVDRRVGGMTAGVNPARRNASLAMASFLADEVLAEPLKPKPV